MTTITGQTFTQKIGEPGAPQNTHTLLLNGARDTIYKNCIFDGDGIKLDNCTNIIFDGGIIKNARRGSGNHQAIFMGGSNAIQFLSGFAIQDCNQVGQIYGGNDCRVEDVTFLRCGYGLKWSVNGVKNLRVNRVKIKRLRAMGMEFQYDDANTNNIYIGNCSYDEPERFDDDSKNDGATMAFSFPFVRANGVVIETLYADGLAWLLNSDGSQKNQQRGSSTGWRGVRIGIECGGQGAIIRNNWIRRLNDAGSLIPGSANCQVGPNLIQDCIEPFNMQGGSASGSNAFGKNDSSVQLPASGGWSLVGAVPPGQTAPPDPIPPVIPPATQPKIVDVTVRFDDGSTVVTKP